MVGIPTTLPLLKLLLKIKNGVHNLAIYTMYNFEFLQNVFNLMGELLVLVPHVCSHVRP